MDSNPSSVFSFHLDSSVGSALFNSTEELFKESCRIAWLAKLNAVLPKDRKSCLAKMHAIWSELLSTQQTASLEEAKKFISAKFRTFPGPKIKHFIAEEFESAQSIEDILQIAQKFLSSEEDLQCAPLDKTKRGLKGPTILVGSPIYNTYKKSMEIPSYVIKWMGNNYELYSNLVMKKLSELLLSSNLGHSVFYVPQITGLDFEKNVHYLTDGNRVRLQNGSDLENNFRKIAASIDETPSKRQIYLFEKINGENAIDFFKTKYIHLNEYQKLNLFKQFGRLTTIDLILGNHDRLARVSFENDSFQLCGDSANLGNIMLVWDPAKGRNSILYAIDNGIKQKTLKHPEKYSQFIKEIFSKPDFANLLSDQMIEAMRSSIVGDDDIHLNDPGIAAFLTDLENPHLSKQMIQKGLMEMNGWLREVLISDWKNQKGEEIQQVISSYDSNFMQAVNMRIDSFVNSRSTQ